MKTAGIIGGIGPESTIEYYRQMIALYRERKPDGSSPSLIINSIDLKKMLGLIAENKLKDVADYLLAEISRLSRAGADFGALAANTPHIVFDELKRRSPIPLISIVEATCEAAKALGVKCVGLFGTRFTMQGRFYRDVLDRAGISLMAPTIEEQDYIHDKYMNELVSGLFLTETRERLLSIIKRMRSEDGIEGLILGGTELPLILREGEYEGVRLLDTTKLHVERIVARLLA